MLRSEYETLQRGSEEVKGATCLSLVSVPAGDRCRFDGYIFNNGANYGVEISKLFAAAHGMNKVHRSKTPRSDNDDQYSGDDETGGEDSGRYVIHE